MEDVACGGTRCGSFADCVWSAFLVLVRPCNAHAGRMPPSGRGDVKPAYVLKGQVTQIVMLSEYTGVVIPVGVDPRFVVVIEKVQVISGSVPGEIADRMAFAIHSPVRLFMDDQEQVIGRWYDFTAYVDDRLEKSPCLLEASSLTDDQR